MYNKQLDETKIKLLMQATDLDEALIRLLIERNIDTAEKIESFLHPSLDELHSPFDIENMQIAVDVIKKHLANNSKILIFGDYDCDGIGASAILYLALKNLGVTVASFIPTRQTDGYGLSKAVIDKLVEKDKPDLIITVDCGISAVEEVAYVKSLGMEIIVTDHHEPQQELPDCILVDPKMQNDYPELCGAGVALKLVEALTNKENALKYTDICAISTIADLVPLVSDNRIIAKFGIAQINKGYAVGSRNKRLGLNALINKCLNGERKLLDSYDLAFKIAPRLNAAGRLSDAQKSFDLLVSDDSYLVNTLAEELELENKARQDLCTATALEAEEMLSNYNVATKRIIILYNDKWEGGVIGIAAAKLTQDYQRPTILFTKKGDVLKGSARSILGINIHDVITACKADLLQFGGHSMAAGMTLKPEMLEKFVADCDDYIRKTYGNEPFLPYFKCDGELDFSIINMPFVKALKDFEPFGMSNPKPLFYDYCESLPFKRIAKYNHIKCATDNDIEIIGFNYFSSIGALRSVMPKNLYFNIDIDNYHNNEYIKAFIKDIELLDIIPEELSLCYQFFDKYLTDRYDFASRQISATSDDIFGHLVICFHIETYNELVAKYPTYRRQYGILDTVNPYNTILLAPQNKLNLGYYGKIDVYDTPAEIFNQYLLSYFGDNVNIINNNPDFKKWHLEEVTIEALRNTFIILKDKLNGNRFTDAMDIYKTIANNKYKYSATAFIIMYLIFKEMGLITRDKNSIISVKNFKVDLNNSKILRAVNKLCKN